MKAVSKYNHIIWDWNGTLLDDSWLFVDVMNEILRNSKMTTITLDKYRDIFGFPVKDYYLKLGFDLEKEPFKETGLEFINAYEKRKYDADLHIGVKTLLKKLIEKGFSHSILSAQHQSTLDNLIEYLQDNYTTNNVLSYDSARDILYGDIDNENGTVSCVYTNFAVNNVPENSPRPTVHAGGLDCEHVWPQSMYEGSSPMKSDMHHLRPCKSNVNNSRGNKPFNEINDFQTDNWYWLNYSTSNIPTTNIDKYSETKSANFEPREDRKGDIARTMFYFYTIYHDVADEAFFELQKEILYQWHMQDQITEEEIQRTGEIASYQNNIPNPFIIDSSLIYRCYFFNPELGDANLDNIINIVDVVLVVSFILGETELSNEQFINSDIDNNLTINVSDIIALIDIILS